MLYPTGLEANGTAAWLMSGLFADPPSPASRTAFAGDWDMLAAIDVAAPGIVVTRELLDAVAEAFAANDYQALTASEIVAIVGPLPSYPSGLVRISDSNPAIDGWSIDKPGRY